MAKLHNLTTHLLATGNKLLGSHLEGNVEIRKNA